MSATLNKIAEISSDLYNVHKKFNGTVKSHKWDRMQDVYAAINQSMVTWEKSLRKQVETMQNYMMKSFKYSLKEFESFNEVVKLRNSAGQEYFKSWVELENKKEKLFLAGEVQKWEIDFKEVKLTPEDVLKNKKVAKMLMLPQVASTEAANIESETDAESLRLHEHPDARAVRVRRPQTRQALRASADRAVQRTHRELLRNFDEPHEPQQPHVQHLQEDLRCREKTRPRTSTAGPL